ncbi:MAG: FtsW/RodA/SpoVE family cell cycle protein [Candidatus Aquicultorales bacterium]
MIRARETVGLIAALGISALAFLLVGLGRNQSINLEAVLLAAYLAVPFLALHLILMWRKRPFDQAILPLVALLTGVGTATIYRLNPSLGTVQVTWVAVGGMAAALTLLLIPEHAKLKEYKYTLALAGIALLLAPIVAGKSQNGAKLWLEFGSLSFQPSELAKVFMVVFFAAYLESKKELLSISTRRLLRIWVPEAKHLGPLVLMWVVSLAVLVFERDLGTSLLFFGVFLVMLYIATGRPIYTFLGSLLFLGGATAAYKLFSHVRVRVDIWLDPWTDPQGIGYQIVQSLIAIASGGLTGTGLGRGYPTYIPVVSTDFIFSAISEELGYVGALAVVLAYLLLVERGLKASLAAEDAFSKLLAVGLTTAFGLQAFMIMAGVMKLVPLTGITLPFMSYGGSSILANFILVALLLEVSSRRRA